MSGQNMIVLVLVIVVIIGLIFYLNGNDEPIPNQGKVTMAPRSTTTTTTTMAPRSTMAPSMTMSPNMGLNSSSAELEVKKLLMIS